MSGLLAKDLKLILSRKQSVLVFILMPIILCGLLDDATFVVGYTMFLFIILALSTISYDEFDNGYPFLMTLPIKPSTYADEKYVFCAGLGIFGFVYAMIVYYVSAIVKGIDVSAGENFLAFTIFIPLILILMDIMIPLQIKFGSEKSRIVMIVIAGILVASGFAVKSIDGAEEMLTNLAQNFSEVSEMQFVLYVFAIAIVLTAISAICSCKFMAKKEF